MPRDQKGVSEPQIPAVLPAAAPRSRNGLLLRAHLEARNGVLGGKEPEQGSRPCANRAAGAARLLLGGGLAELEAFLPLADRDQEVVPLVEQVPHRLLQPQDQSALLGDLLP
jgi:hypothetical protein